MERGNGGSDRRRQKSTDHNDKRMRLKLERHRMRGISEDGSGSEERVGGMGGEMAQSDAS